MKTLVETLGTLFAARLGTAERPAAEARADGGGGGGGDFRRPDRRVPWWARLAGRIDRRVTWHRLPLPLALLVFVGLRRVLRARNLYDTNAYPTLPLPPPTATGTDHLTARTADGTFNDLSDPRMGSAGMRFGRNVPPADAAPEPAPTIMEPNPRLVSNRLMARGRFIPAPHLNLLAAAWIQFMIKDWFSHGPGTKDDPIEVPIAPDDDWWQRPMRIMRTVPDATRPPGPDGAPPTFLNTETHWWDGSQIYGRNAAEQRAVRAGVGGKLNLTADGRLPVPLLDRAAQDPGWWLGLAMMFTLFAREHNAICDRLLAAYPTWTDDELFQRARLVNAALMAKIHTTEWTPAIISHPATRFALRANWWGVQGERLTNLLGRLTRDEVLSGIPGTPTDHHTAPYALTEEFHAVYRMHPLIPDDYDLRAARDDRPLGRHGLDELTDTRGNAVLGAHDPADLFYTFGTSHPGAIALRNYPRHLREFRRPDGVVVDLASIDLMRMREMGVPRYNRFRRLFHLNPVRRFEELTDDPALAEEIRDLYGGDIERVDLMVGLFAEPKPAGFGFSDTAFRVFILMASRRLKSDRFLSADFTPRVYTRTGLDWIAANTMATVLRRHYPALESALAGLDNAFAPWPRPAP